jgi:preprotein translocase subunit SecG
LFTFFVVIHVLICVALVLIVLLQAGRGGGLAGAFGAQTAQTLFGGRGAATFLTKATAWLAGGFMLMSILLAVLSSRSQVSGDGLLQQRARERASQAQLPPSTSTFTPGAAESAAAVPVIPGTQPESPGSKAPAAPGAQAPATPAPATPTP